MLTIEPGQTYTPEQINQLIEELNPKRRSSEYRKGKYGHTITRQFSGFAFVRSVRESRYEAIATPRNY